MSNICKKCKEERHYIGVATPSRTLCACESGKCSVKGCDDVASIVEFQHPVRNGEPRLKSKDAYLFCLEHRPEGFPVSQAIGETLDIDPADNADNAEAVDPSFDNAKTRANKKGRGRLPHIDPAWEAVCPNRLPSRANSSLLVKCVECLNVHEMRQRVMFNGSYSYCPHCGETMSVPEYREEEEEVAHVG